MTTAEPPAGRRGRPWDEQAIREALADFLVGRHVWPTYREFVAGGAKGLRDAIARIHGPAWWAEEMGVSGGRRTRGGVRRWTEQSISAALGELIGDADRWPSHREFSEAGLRGLLEVIAAQGGTIVWAAKMGVSPLPGARPARRAPRVSTARSMSEPWPRWTEPTIARELSEFVAARQEWPRYAEFIAAGRQDLYHAVRAHGGARLWAKRMGFAWPDRPGGRSSWSDERLRAALVRFLDGRTEWPTGREFDQAGQSALLRAARRHGGTDRWIHELGLTR